MVITIITIFLWVVFFNTIINLLLINKIEKQTRFVDDNRVGLQLNYLLLFIFFGWFCFLIIPYIKKKRRTDYMSYIVNYYKFWKLDYYNERVNNYDRILKMEKLKSKLKKW
jgi:hypothetical protein